MATSSQARPKERALIEAQIRECYGRVIYTHKTHEKCADILQDRLAAIKIIQIVLSALTTASFLVIVFGSSWMVAAIGGLCSLILLALNSYTKDLDLGEIAQRHRQAAIEIWLARERYLALLTDIRIGADSIDTLTERRDGLLSDLHAIYSGAPSTNVSTAYRRAQKALQISEDMTFTDAEIDAFLPDALRSTAV